MGDFFSYEWIPILLNMSLTASAVILCVLLVRLLLCRAPRVFSYALWAVVLFRLLCPVSLTAGFSLLGLTDAPVRAAAAHATVVEYVPQDVVHAPEPQVVLPVPDGVNDALNTVLPQGEEQTAADPLEAPVAIAALVWLAGVLAMAGYSAVSLVRLRRRLAGAVPLEGNVWLADHISTPFVLGLFRPRIYLPSALPEGERSYILLHERHHIRRLDHIVKLIAFAALCVHWFNPLVWLAFVLLGRDMEMSCDEAVLKKLGESVRADYSASLLSLATGRRIIAGTPLAFGEGDTGSRVKNVLRWRRPRTGLVLLAAAVCVAVIAACAANPREDGGEGPGELAGTYASMEDFAREAMSADTVTYYTTDGREATAQVTAAKLAWLEKVGEVEGLAPEGTLEAWGFNYLVQVDADDVMLVGGMYEEDGWYDLEGQGGHDLVALRYPDGSYDILYDAIVNDGLDFYGYHHSYEEAIYDWYVAEYGLDLPLYVEDWIDRVEVPEGGSLGNLPAHRFDGDGWYLYIPVSAWDRAAAEDPENQWQWVSGYGTGSCLLVDRFTTSVHDQQTVCWKQGFVSADESGTVWSHPDRNTRYYLHELPDGGSIRVTIDYDDGRITDYPYIAMEPQVLQLMAESFTVDEHATTSAESQPPLATEAKAPAAPSAPSETEVLEARKLALEGMSEREAETLTLTMANVNLYLEHLYMEENIFGLLSDPHALYWNRFHETGEIQIGWAYDGEIDMEAVCRQEDLTEEEFYAKYGTPVVTENRYDADDFIDLIEELREPVQNAALKADLQEIMDLTELAKNTHVMEYVNSMYKKIHDLDYFLLRYGPTDVGPYVVDDSTISKYYGTLSIYQ